MVSGKWQMLRKCCFIIIFGDKSPSTPHTPFSMPNYSSNLVQSCRPLESKMNQPPTAPAGCCCHLLVTTGTGLT